MSAVALGIGLGAIYLSLRLGRGGPAVRRAVLALLAAHVAFSILNITVYDEPESAAFLLVDALIAGLVSLPDARAFLEAGAAEAAR